ncbi:MAG TPA: ribonuclease III domain-containing protein [Saprospiraceae bacterium]|nr:ribonuclease III domain-containing protein [Saprospiraceae bacterium]
MEPKSSKHSKSGKHSKSNPEPNKRWSNKKFKKYLTKLLQRGNVNKDHIELFLSKKNLAKFKIAFTHPSMREGEDYQIYEFSGDVIVNAFIANYVRFKFPKIIHVKWFTRLKHNIQSDKMLAKIAMKEGLENFVRYGEEMEYLRLNPHLDEKEEYMKMMEDVLEAFFGCLSDVIQESGKLYGVAIEVCGAIMASFLDTLNISLKFEDVFDPVTILKELYEDKRIGLGWPNDQVYLFQKQEGDVPLYTSYVYGWPLGDRVAIFRKKYQVMGAMHYRGEYEEIDPHKMTEFIKYNDKNKVLLATATAKNKKEAKMEGAKKALDVLRTKYGIVSMDQDPYSKKKFDPSRSKLAQSRVTLE